jgi:predicted Zn-dependent peptidase
VVTRSWRRDVTLTRLTEGTTHLVETTFANGLCAVAVGRPGTSTVATKNFLKAGSRHDGERHGIGHCLEHALFRGAATRTSRELHGEIEDLLAGIVGLETLLTGEFEPFAEAGRGVRGVTPEDVPTVANAYLDTERHAVALVGPLDGGSPS